MSKASDTVSFDQLRNTMQGLYRIGKKWQVDAGPGHQQHGFQGRQDLYLYFAQVQVK
ncbi:hypothetical protein BBD26_1529 [Lactobacillus delbrueckii subsp. bulgaricus]|nr:hypothetical protein BBD26_1529 [Lactobacillus delbrueckii subsp. bulgaricus]